MTSTTNRTSCRTFEVRHFTICDGWTSCWTVLDEFLAEIAADIAFGYRVPDEGYDAGEFIIVERDSEQPPSSGDRE